MFRIKIALKAIPDNRRRLEGTNMSQNTVEVIEHKLKKELWSEKTLDHIMISLKWPNISILCKKKGNGFFCLPIVKDVIKQLEVERSLIHKTVFKKDENKEEKWEAQRIYDEAVRSQLDNVDPSYLPAESCKLKSLTSAHLRVNIARYESYRMTHKL